MLSPGKWHLQVPKEWRANLRFRMRLLQQSRDPIVRKALYQACSEDLLFYVNAFVWQYNPRKKGRDAKVGPFITWDFQDQMFLSMLECVENDNDLLIEKSREMGVSWACLIVLEWLWHFRPWNKFLCISRSEKAVEDEDPDSLFWKIDFIHDHLPDWLMPGGSRANVKRRKLYYGNLDNGSTITGEASTGRAGVGGRATAMFIDEFSQIKEDYEVLHRTSDTTGCRIFNGTHCGTGTAFAELANRVDMKKLVLHWTQHPDKKPGLYRYDKDSNSIKVLDRTHRYLPDFDFVYSEAPAGGPCPGLRSPWYDRECGRKGSSRAVAMDLDIDPGGSVAQVFNALTIRSLIGQYAVPPYWEGDILFDRDSGRPGGLTPLPGGPLKVWCRLDEGKFPPAPYGAGADVSTGSGTTNSCFSAVNRLTGEKVLEYATATCPPEIFALICTALGWMLLDEGGEPALFAWEHDGPGAYLGKRVIEVGYRHIYYRQGHMTLAGGKVSEQPGWYPSNDQKVLLIHEYRAALDSRRYVNRSEAALKECLHFRYNSQGNIEHSGESGGDDPTGARVNHGDRVVADALSCKMIKGKTGRPPQPENKTPVGSLAWRRELVDAQNAREDAW